MNKSVLWFVFGVIVAIVGGVLVQKVLVAVSSPPGQHVRSVIVALEGDEIVLGAPDDAWFGLGAFPAVVYEVKSVDETVDVGFIMFSENGETVMLYSLNGKLVAAQYARGIVDTSLAYFYFVDHELFARVVAALANK